MSDIDFQNGFIVGMATKGLTSGGSSGANYGFETKILPYLFAAQAFSEDSIIIPYLFTSVDSAIAGELIQVIIG